MENYSKQKQQKKKTKELALGFLAAGCHDQAEAILLESGTRAATVEGVTDRRASRQLYSHVRERHPSENTGKLCVVEESVPRIGSHNRRCGARTARPMHVGIHVCLCARHTKKQRGGLMNSMVTVTHNNKVLQWGVREYSRR